MRTSFHSTCHQQAQSRRAPALPGGPRWSTDRDQAAPLPAEGPLRLLPSWRGARRRRLARRSRTPQHMWGEGEAPGAARWAGRLSHLHKQPNRWSDGQNPVPYVGGGQRGAVGTGQSTRPIPGIGMIHKDEDVYINRRCPHKCGTQFPRRRACRAWRVFLSTFHP